MRDGRTWTFDELRKLLACPEAVDFRLGYVFSDESGRLKREERIVAVVGGEELKRGPQESRA